MPIPLKKTKRGFKVGVFTDLYGNECSIQDSSLATQDAVWVGIDDPKPQVLIPGEGWQPVEFPEGTAFWTRMHLGRDQAAELIEVLQRFVNTGSISESFNPESN